MQTKTNSLGPVPEGQVAREARLVHRDHRLVVGDVEVDNGQGRLLAKALVTYTVVSGG